MRSGGKGGGSAGAMGSGGRGGGGDGGGGEGVRPRMRSAAFSAIMMVGAFKFPLGKLHLRLANVRTWMIRMGMRCCDEMGRKTRRRRAMEGRRAAAAAAGNSGGRTPFVMRGIIEESTTRRPSIPITRVCSSTTAVGSVAEPILHVPPEKNTHDLL